MQSEQKVGRPARSELTKSEKQFICSQNRRSVGGRHAQHGAQKQFGRTTTGASFLLRVGRPTGTSPLPAGVRSTDRSTEGRSWSTGRSVGSCFLSAFELRFWSEVESDCDFLKLQDYLAINKGVEPHELYPSEKTCIVCLVNKISLSLAPRT